MARSGRHVVHHLAARRPADDLHSVFVLAVLAHGDTPDAAGAPWEQGRVPAPQAVVVQWRVVGLGGVVDHLHQTIHRPHPWPCSAQAQAAHHRRAHRSPVQHLALDGGRGHHLVRKHALRQLATGVQADRVGLAFHHPLGQTRLPQRRAHHLGVKLQGRPARLLPDVARGFGRHEPHHSQYGSFSEPHSCPFGSAAARHRMAR